MPRTIETFTGKYAVIGCSATLTFCTHECHPEESYFSINSDKSAQPDLIADITAPLPEGFKNRFELTFVENLDWDAYNLVPIGRRARQAHGDKGFKNMLEMTAEDGFIIISGCDRFKESRNSMQNMHYVEFSRDNADGYGCVLIPKNQNLTVEEVNQQIKSHPEISSLIKKLNKITYMPNDYQFTSCPIPYESLPTLFGKDYTELGLSESQIASLEHNKNLPEVKALYNKLSELKDKDKKQNKHEVLWTRDCASVYSSQLTRNADYFFQHNPKLVQSDIAIFQQKFALLMKQDIPTVLKNETKLIQELSDIVDKLSDINKPKIDLPGRYSPVFFEAGHEQMPAPTAKSPTDNFKII